ncbi:MAG TPA: TlpA disulfide reductase family protein [Bryobacteraceae bacterium]|jgi:peroxiredoxin
MRIFAAILLCALCLAGQSLSRRRAPSFSLPDSTITQHDILDYRGKWLLLDFMKTDCPHCMALSKTLEQVKTQFGPKVAILSVVIAPPENTTTVARYVVDNKLTTTFVFDQGQVAAAYFKATPARPAFDTPHLFVINPGGSIVRDWSDTDATTEILEGSGLARELQALIAGTAAAPPSAKQK